MKVQEVKLKYFRNVKEAVLCPDSKLNFLIGKNGQGKTSFLEAIGYLAVLRSFRDCKTPHVIQWGLKNAEVSANLFCLKDEEEWKSTVKVAFANVDNQPSKVAYVNDKPFRSSTQYLSQRFGSFHLGFHTVVFNPSDHDLIRGTPTVRRSYLNAAIAAEDLDYLKILQKYQRVLLQRNAILKSPELFSRPVFSGFTEQLCQYGSQLVHKRLNWIKKLSPFLQSILTKIAPNQGPISIALTSNCIDEDNRDGQEDAPAFDNFAGQQDLPSLEELERAFLTKATSNESAERKMGCTLLGPHRDDWTFLSGNQTLKGHGSQGEVRSVLLSLKLAEVELFWQETGHKPLFLLDDFSSELDRERRLFLLEYLTNADLQTFVTTTEDLEFLGKRYWICNGVIEEGKHD